MSKLDLAMVDPRLQQGLLASGESIGVGAPIHQTSIQINEPNLAYEPSLHMTKELLGTRFSIRIELVGG